MVSFLPTPDNLGIRIVMVLASTVFVAAVRLEKFWQNSLVFDIMIRN